MEISDPCHDHHPKVVQKVKVKEYSQKQDFPLFKEIDPHSFNTDLQTL
jgi:hypothetical protein